MTKDYNKLFSSFELVKLEICHCGQILELQNLVYDALSNDEKSFIVLKSAEQIIQNLSGENFAVGLIEKASGALIGMEFLLSNGSQKSLNGLMRCQDVERYVLGVEKYGVICTVMVSPHSRKIGCMELMLECLQTEAHYRNYAFLAAEVAVGNTASHQGFLREGFEPFGTATDPRDGMKVDYLALSPPLCKRPIFAYPPSAKAVAFEHASS